MNTNNILRLINPLFKGIILVLLVVVLYRQVYAREDFDMLAAEFVAHLLQVHLPFLVAALLLMPLNWALETWKWKVLMAPFSSVSFRQAMQAVLCGVALALITPNRIGDYGGRLLQLNPEHHVKGLSATLAGNLGQLVVLLSCGLAGLIYFGTRYLGMLSAWSWHLLWLGGIMIMGLILCFFNLGRLIRMGQKIPAPKRIRSWIQQLEVLNRYTKWKLGQTLLLAFSRYVVYTMQYYLVLCFFGVYPPFWATISGIASIFFIQSSILLPPLTGLVARGEIALLVWSPFTANELSILAATFTLFIINLSIPALLGTGILVRTNLNKSLGYEKTYD